jgi:hypothetical protein
MNPYETSQNSLQSVSELKQQNPTLNTNISPVIQFQSPQPAQSNELQLLMMMQMQQMQMQQMKN